MTKCFTFEMNIRNKRLSILIILEKKRQMKGITADDESLKKAQRRHKDQVKDFYENATADYLHWSKQYNMHFGYYKAWSNPFDREQMLAQMNEKVMHELHIKEDTEGYLIDMGCGMGATMRHINEKRKGIKAIGYTISEWQIKEGNCFLKKQGVSKAKICFEDITKAPTDHNKADFAIAIESFCHTTGKGKINAIKHLSTRLKKGARFVIADAFGLKHQEEFGFIGKYVHSSMCKAWEIPSLANIDELCQNLYAHGMGKLKVEKISWRVAPSVLHVPFAISSFIIKSLYQGKRLSTYSINNLKGSFSTLLSSLCMNEIAYCMISGEKIR